MKEKQQIWGSRLSAAPDKVNIEFCAGRDVKAIPMADEELLEFDIWTNLAHARMLNKTGIINQKEFDNIHKGLVELQEKLSSNSFVLDPAKEDVHINIEHFLTNSCNIEAAKKIHSGRSRNDQVATDMRLYLRDRLILILKNLLELVQVLIDKAANEIESVMPGFTHYQPAMITTAAHWITSWSQALLRDSNRFLFTLREINSCPLGAAASFGTSWPIDREYSSVLLGFDAVDENSIDCISSRGEYEAEISANMSNMMNHLGTISQDIILLSTPFYDMLEIDDRFVTGSSIMPQKRNPDFAELIRSKAAYSHGTLMSLLGTLKGSMSGYNRDSQQTKYLIMDLFRECIPVAKILAGVCESMVFKRETMLKHTDSGFMNAADVADWLAREYSLSFRESYEVISLAVKYSNEKKRLTFEAIKKAIEELKIAVVLEKNKMDFLDSPSSMISMKNHTGGPAPEAVKKMITNQRRQLETHISQITEFERNIDAARKKCFALNA